MGHMYIHHISITIHSFFFFHFPGQAGCAQVTQSAKVTVVKTWVDILKRHLNYFLLTSASKCYRDNKVNTKNFGIIQLFLKLRANHFSVFEMQQVLRISHMKYVHLPLFKREICKKVLAAFHKRCVQQTIHLIQNVPCFRHFRREMRNTGILPGSIKKIIQPIEKNLMSLGVLIK